MEIVDVELKILDKRTEIRGILDRKTEINEVLNEKIDKLWHEIDELERLLKKESRKAMGDWTTFEILGPWEYVEDLYGDGIPALLYSGKYHIYLYDEEYSLVLENEEFLSQSLSELEAILAEYKILAMGDSPWVAEYRGGDYGIDSL